MNIEFVTPTFNDFTLNFPPATEKTVAEVNHDIALQTAAELNAVQKANVRKERRNLRQLLVLAAGGWIIEFESREHFGAQTSNRGERRRQQLGRK